MVRSLQLALLDLKVSGLVLAQSTSSLEKITPITMFRLAGSGAIKQSLEMSLGLTSMSLVMGSISLVVALAEQHPITAT